MEIATSLRSGAKVGLGAVSHELHFSLLPTWVAPVSLPSSPELTPEPIVPIPPRAPGMAPLVPYPA